MPAPLSVRSSDVTLWHLSRGHRFRRRAGANFNLRQGGFSRQERERAKGRAKGPRISAPRRRCATSHAPAPRVGVLSRRREGREADQNRVRGRWSLSRMFAGEAEVRVRVNPDVRWLRVDRRHGALEAGTSTRGFDAAARRKSISVCRSLCPCVVSVDVVDNARY